MSDKESAMENNIISTKEISEILGLSDRRIRQLENEGALVKIGHGKFDLPKSIQRYIEYIKEESQNDEETDYYHERALLTKANRQKAELELKIMNGEVHRSEDVEAVMNDMLSSFRAQLLVIPGKLAPQLINQTELEFIKSILKDSICEALQELSEYDPNSFYAKSKDKISIDTEEEDNGGNKKEKEVNKESPKNGKRKKASK